MSVILFNIKSEALSLSNLYQPYMP